ncbi:HI_0552 family protein [Streptococcus dentiloxodontae]
MFQEIARYLTFQGFKYIKPEKAGPLADEMTALKKLGQAARSEFTEIAKTLAPKVAPFELTRVSNWANQAQVARPHFWCYYRQPEDAQDDVALAIRLYGSQDDFGISVEVSFIERKKSQETLLKQHKVLDLPIAEPLYYFVQEQGISHRLAGTNKNRLRLKDEIAAGQVRKVLVKYDIPMTAEQTLPELTDKLAAGFDKLLPYYEVTRN